MNLDFHYYGTYCAARYAGYEMDEAKVIAYYAQFVDECSKDFLDDNKIEAFPTVQSNSELAKLLLNPEKYTDWQLKEAAWMWGTFHFLPCNEGNNFFGRYGVNSAAGVYRRLCMPDSRMLVRMVENAKVNATLPGIGMAMHILADTWAHCYFAGVPEKCLNNASGDVWEVDRQGNNIVKFSFSWDPFEDNLPKNRYSCTMPNSLRERSIVYLGHGRMGHLPDYSWLRYKYTPEWAGGEAIVKNNPECYMKAFCQMIYAMQYIRGDINDFSAGEYAVLGQDTKNRIAAVINARKLDSSGEWKDFIRHYLSAEDERAGGLEDFNKKACLDEYRGAVNRDNTDLGKFFYAAASHKEFVERELGVYP